MELRLPMLEPLEDVYQRWWDPTFRLQSSIVLDNREPLPRAARPHCGMWYALPAPIPTTATWALVHVAFPPGKILYVKSREAGLSMLGKIPLEDHPHIRLIDIRVPDAFERALRSAGWL